MENKCLKSLLTISLSSAIALGIATQTATVFAAMPSGTVMIGDYAYSLDYANNIANESEISEAVANGGGKIFIKSFDDSWIDNNTAKNIDVSSIKAVTYKDAKGVATKYKEKDGDAVAQDSNTPGGQPGGLQTKADIATVVKELVTAGTINQSQADKIIEEYSTNTQTGPGPNGPFEKLINAGTITEDQEHAIMDKLFGGPGGAGGAGNVMPGGGMGDQSTDTSSIKTKYLDVAYATKSTTQKLDIYMPNSGNGPFPVIINIHAGGFMMGDKSAGIAPMLKGLDRGYAIVSIDYRLSGEAIFPAAINDVKAAIKFIRANASKYNLDPNKIATWGSSAGGNLAALAGTSGDVKELEDASLGNADVSSKVQAVVDWFGPIDFDQMDAQFTASGMGQANHNASNSPESKYLGATGGLTTVADLVKETNPTTYITNDDPAFFIEHGTKDGNVPIQQSLNLQKALEDVIGKDKVTFTPVEGAGHGGAEFETTENVNKVLDFLDKYLK